MTRNEANLSIELARDSRTIASASKRDSSSMKTLAAMTVMFLPGTLVASLFSMPMFDWNNANGNVLSHRFWIYWAITLPLTFVTVGAWVLWTYKHAFWERSEDKKALRDLDKVIVYEPS